MSERLALSIPEAAEALGISRNHAYLLAAKGEIPTVRLGKRVVVPVEALRAMWKENSSVAGKLTGCFPLIASGAGARVQPLKAT